MPAARRDVVVAGASAGGVEALRALARSLPADFLATLLVTMHLPPGARSALPMILDRAGPLPALPATHGAPLRPGVIYVAPPDRHLLVDNGSVILTRGPAENGYRPAINATFRSAAVGAGPRTIGVVLSGTLDDGAAGLRAVADRGGVAVVQDPADALYRGMPDSALAAVDAEFVLPANELGAALDKLTRAPVDSADAPPPSAGLLLEVGDAGQYRCRIGHAWSTEALPGAHDTEFQRTLWTALRSLDEKAGFDERLRRDSHLRDDSLLAARYAVTAAERTTAAATPRKFLLSLSGAGVEELL
ncbi:chemotaxis protein CheB [Amycolatopsis pretoriensis]|uniref:chemotaxis protein CheB n=1 Tax=Amycolatopsis pretoriensis TaxID=218821 RepID=UPI001FCA33E9|nr:chemotaxis protein CheB [Amycolatopsis pretoriensis]